MVEEETGGDDGVAEGPATSTTYVVEGGIPLRGTVPISGAKNAVLKLMAAAVLCDEPCTIANAPIRSVYDDGHARSKMKPVRDTVRVCLWSLAFRFLGA